MPCVVAYRLGDGYALTVGAKAVALPLVDGGLGFSTAISACKAATASVVLYVQYFYLVVGFWLVRELPFHVAARVLFSGCCCCCSDWA